MSVCQVTLPCQRTAGMAPLSLDRSAPDLHVATARSILCTSPTQKRPGLEARLFQGGRPPQCGFFASVCLRAPLRSMGGRRWGGFGLPVPLDAGLPTLLSARPPHLEVGSGFNPSKEVAFNAPVHARPYRAAIPPHSINRPHSTARRGNRQHVSGRARRNRRGTGRNRGARSCGGASWLSCAARLAIWRLSRSAMLARVSACWLRWHRLARRPITIGACGFWAAPSRGVASAVAGPAISRTRPSLTGTSRRSRRSGAGLHDRCRATPRIDSGGAPCLNTACRTKSR